MTKPLKLNNNDDVFLIFLSIYDQSVIFSNN